MLILNTVRALYREFLLTHDFQLLHWLNHNHLPFSINLLKFISTYTTHVSIAIILAVLVLGVFNRSKTIRIKFLVLLLVFASNSLITRVCKNLFNRERPGYCFTEIDRYVYGGSPSFPSGHSSEVASLAISMIILFPHRRRVKLILLWALLIGYSRMALGVHYPSDVFAGFVLGGVIGWSISTFANDKFLARKNEELIPYNLAEKPGYIQI